MGLSVGIVGLPNVGKSTLFNALLKKQQALAANYPFATIEPNVGVVPVPDARLQKLAEVVAYGLPSRDLPQAQPDPGMKFPPLVPATVTFVDIAGIVKGASEGEGLGNKFLSHIRETDVICLVVRAFEDTDVVQTGSGDPKTDAEVLMTELILADLQTVSKQVAPKGNVTPEQKKRWAAIEKVALALNDGKAARTAVDEEERVLIRELGLMTMKPVLYVVNVDEATLTEKSQIANSQIGKIFADKIGVSVNDIVIISAKIEAELAGFSEAEQTDYLKELGFAESGLERLIKTAYDRLGLASFLTAGEKEVRAWTIKQGMTTQEGSGVIHTDFMKKFIKAEVVAFEDFVGLGGWKGAREAGKARSEGRDYIMKDGDVVEFKIGS